MSKHKHYIKNRLRTILYLNLKDQKGKYYEKIIGPREILELDLSEVEQSEIQRLIKKGHLRYNVKKVATKSLSSNSKEKDKSASKKKSKSKK